MCYHPNILSYHEDGIIRKDGQKGIHRLQIIFCEDDYRFKGYEYYLKENERLKGTGYGYKLIPCGKCKACRKQEKLTWATRIECEAKQYTNNYFLTLTYDPENITIPDYTINEKTGEIYENNGWWQGTLVKKDLQTFIKSLRKYFEREYNHQGMKYYAAGEYGELNERPHYHIILMNTPELEQHYIGSNEKGNYHSNYRIEQIWHKGFITLENVTWDTIAYTAGYCQKKMFGELREEYYKQKGQLPVFAQMSRRPGIGRKYFEKNYKSIYECDEIINSKGMPVRPPSYFDRLMDAGEHDFMQSLKQKRTENAENKIKLKLSKTDLTLKEQLRIEEETAKEMEKKYIRRYKTL